MRPDDRFDPVDGRAADAPLDADLTGLDAELAGAGAYARRAHASEARPTAAYAGRLRQRLLARLAAGDEAASAGTWRANGQPARGAAMSNLVQPGEAWTPVPLAPRIASRAAVAQPRPRWAFLAAAALSLVVVAGALGVGLGRLLPPPRPEPSATPVEAAVATASPLAPTDDPVIVGPTVVPTDEPAPTPNATAAPTTAPAATPKPAPTPKATVKPEPTKPPIGPMDLLAKACPGGVILDWTKPSTAVAHYHVLRSLDGDVPTTYPADSAVEVETATTWSATTTDGFDAGLDGSTTAWYRAFAFDGEDNLLAVSPSRTVNTADAISLGALTVEPNGPGSISVSWSAAVLNSACFTYGKLVASEEDPDPSYVNGSPYLAAIGDASATGVTIDGLTSGKTVWMRYELVRVTSTGKFIVGRTSVLQVTYP